MAKVYPQPTPPTASATPVDLDISAVPVSQVAPNDTQLEAKAIADRAVVDLRADDAITRRDARARLASVLAKLDRATAVEILNNVNDESYRMKLGIAVSLNNASNSFTFDAATRDLLAAEFKKATDPTLKTQLTRALQRK